MLHHLDQSLEAFLRSRIPLSRDEVDVAFDAPDKEWGSGVSRPTVNLFLWDIRRSAEESMSGIEQVQRNGETFWRRRPPRFEFSYLCTAWTNEVEDEHQLLGGVLNTLVAHPDLPEEFMVGPLAEMRPLPTLKVGRVEGGHLSEFWSAIEGKFKAGLDLVVTTTIDPAVLVPLAPPAEDIGVGIGDMREPRRVSQRRRVGGRVEDRAAVGAVVRSPRGSSVVEADGHFLIDALPGDEITVETDPPRSATVPETGPVQL